MFGGVVFQLNAPKFNENDRLALFRTECERADEKFTLEMTDDLRLPGGEPVFKDEFVWHYRDGEREARVTFDERSDGILMIDTEEENGHRVLYNEAHIDYLGSNLAQKIMDVPRRIIRHGGIFLHSSYIDVNGEAILFTAQKQVGKSTQAKLWRDLRGAEIVNGDRAILRRAEDGHWFAWGSPYCGTSKICNNRSLPVKAVVILSQGEVSKATRAGVRQSFAAMLDGCSFNTWDRRQTESAARICGDIITEVPFYSLSCVPDESAVKALEEIL